MEPAQFKITKEKKDNTLIIRLSGLINESSSFEQWVGPDAQHSQVIQVYCKDVVRINSAGVKGWIKYFGSLAEQGTRLEFFECSPPIVEQLSAIVNFSCKGTIRSLCLPLNCSQCKGNFIQIASAPELKKSGFQIPSMKCPQCEGALAFDDVPEEYFACLRR